MTKKELLCLLLAIFGGALLMIGVWFGSWMIAEVIG